MAGLASLFKACYVGEPLCGLPWRAAAVGRPYESCNPPIGELLCGLP